MTCIYDIEQQSKRPVPHDYTPLVFSSNLTTSTTSNPTILAPTAPLACAGPSHHSVHLRTPVAPVPMEDWAERPRNGRQVFNADTM